jgi:hypothetical protein
MYCTTQNFTQAHTIFGGGYVPEQHGDDTRRYLAPAESREFVVDFAEVLKALRAALSLR